MQEHAGRAYANLVSGSVRQHLSGRVMRFLAEGLEYCDGHEVQAHLAYIRAYSAHFDLDRGRWDVRAAKGRTA